MGIKINGITQLNANVFNEITITEETTGEYVVDVYGGGSVKTSNNKFSKEIENMELEDKIIAIVERYLNNFKINGYTGMVGVLRRAGYNVVYGSSGDILLRLRLFDSKFNDVSKKIMTKYLHDRYNFCWNEDIKLFKLSLDFRGSRYDMKVVECEDCTKNDFCYRDQTIRCDRYCDLTLRTDDKGNVVDFDRKFIEEFLNYKFWEYGKEIDITLNYQRFGSNPHAFSHNYVINCGDIKILVPDEMGLNFIFEMVYKYNDELYNIEKNVKRRQKKMEGF